MRQIEAYDYELSHEDRLWVLTTLLRPQMPADIQHSAELYARRLLATDKEEQGAIRLGLIELTPLRQLLP